MLDPSSDKTLDPYSPEALTRLTLTNLRIRLLKAQSCPMPVHHPAGQMSPKATALTSTSTTESQASAPYAISTLLARGTCLCHGHAEYCIAHNSSQDTRQDRNKVSGFSSAFTSQNTSHGERDYEEKMPVISFLFLGGPVFSNNLLEYMCQDVRSRCKMNSRWEK